MVSLQLNSSIIKILTQQYALSQVKKLDKTQCDRILHEQGQYMKPGYTGIKRLFKATGYSMQGIKAAWKFEAAIRKEILLLVIFIPIALLTNCTAVEKSLLVMSLTFVLIVELLNSAIETAVDRIGPDYHALSGRAKDIGSAAVLVTLLLATAIWFIIFLG